MRSTGKDIDMSGEADCKELYDKGMKVFKSGRIRDSLDLFDAATTKLNYATEFGGLALL